MKKILIRFILVMGITLVANDSFSDPPGTGNCYNPMGDYWCLTYPNGNKSCQIVFETQECCASNW